MQVLVQHVRVAINVGGNASRVPAPRAGASDTAPLSLLRGGLRGWINGRVLSFVRSRLGWRLNFTLVGSHDGTRVAIPILFGDGAQNCSMRERWLFDILRRLLSSRAGAVLDVGVNLGQTLLKVNLVDPDREYIGFEPNPRCAAYADRLIRQNRFRNASIVPAGLAATAGVATLLSKSETDPSASIVTGFREPQRYRLSQHVAVVTGDTAVAQLNLTSLALVKVDVEGAELEVLQGLAETLRRFKPFIVCEILPVYDEQSEVGRFRLQRQRELHAFIISLGYRVRRIHPDGSTVQISELDVHGDLTLSNYLFEP